MSGYIESRRFPEMSAGQVNNTYEGEWVLVEAASTRHVQTEVPVAPRSDQTQQVTSAEPVTVRVLSHGSKAEVLKQLGIVNRARISMHGQRPLMFINARLIGHNGFVGW